MNPALLEEFLYAEASVEHLLDKGRNSVLTVKREPKSGLQAVCTLKNVMFQNGSHGDDQTDIPGPLHIPDSALGSFVSLPSLMLYNNPEHYLSPY